MEAYLNQVARAAERFRDRPDPLDDLDWCPVEREFNSILDCMEEVQIEASRRRNQGHRDFEEFARDLPTYIDLFRMMLRDWQAAENDIKEAL